MPLLQHPDGTASVGSEPSTKSMKGEDYMKDFLAISSMAAMLVASGAAIAQTEIVYGSYSPPSASLNSAGLVPYLEKVEELSEGTIQTQLIAGGALVGTKTTLPGIRDGIVDGGMVVALYYPTDLPVNNTITGLVALGGDGRVDAAASIETTLFDCPTCIEEWEKWNAKYISGYSTTGYSLICVEPASSLQDLAGRKVRAPGGFGRMADALNMVPVNLTITETYEGLQRGQVDCTFGPPGWLRNFSFSDVAKHVMLTQTGSTFGGSLLNLRLDKWSELTDSQKKAVIDAAPAAVAGYVLGYMAEDETALEEAKQKGVTAVEAPDDVMEMLRQHGMADVETVVKLSEERGVENAEEIAAAFVKNHEKWQKIVAERGATQDGYEAALRDEIFSRFPMD